MNTCVILNHNRYADFRIYRYKSNKKDNEEREFDVLLTVHPCIIFCKQNQLGVQIFLICLLFLSTCFGQLCAHHQKKIPYLCDTWYLSLCIDD